MSTELLGAYIGLPLHVKIKNRNLVVDELINEFLPLSASTIAPKGNFCDYIRNTDSWECKDDPASKSIKYDSILAHYNVEKKLPLKLSQMFTTQAPPVHMPVAIPANALDNNDINNWKPPVGPAVHPQTPNVAEQIRIAVQQVQLHQKI